MNFKCDILVIYCCTANIYYLPVPVNQGCMSSLAWCLWLRVCCLGPCSHHKTGEGCSLNVHWVDVGRPQNTCNQARSFVHPHRAASQHSNLFLPRLKNSRKKRENIREGSHSLFSPNLKVTFHIVYHIL